MQKKDRLFFSTLPSASPVTYSTSPKYLCAYEISKYSKNAHRSSNIGADVVLISRFGPDFSLTQSTQQRTTNAIFSKLSPCSARGKNFSPRSLQYTSRAKGMRGSRHQTRMIEGTSIQSETRCTVRSIIFLCCKYSLSLK